METQRGLLTKTHAPNGVRRFHRRAKGMRRGPAGPYGFEYPKWGLCPQAPL